MTTFLGRVLNISLIAAVALVPIFFIPVPWVTLLQAKMLLLAFVAIVAVVTFVKHSFFSGQLHIPLHSMVLAGLLLPICYGISAIGTQGGVASLVGSGLEPDTLAAIIVWFALLFLVASFFAGRPITGPLRAFFFAGAALILFQIAHLVSPQAFSLGGLFEGATGNLVGTWHDLSIVLATLVLLAALRVGLSQSGITRYVISVVGFLSLVFLILINMRDVWIALAVFACIALLAAFIRSRRLGMGIRGLVRQEWPLLVILIVAVLCSFWGTLLHDRLPERIRMAQLEVRPSWQGTYFVGQQSLEQPGSLLFGSGPNTFSTQWNLFKPAAVNQTPFWNADFGAGVGTIPTSFVTLGVAGMVGWGLFLLAVLWSALRFLRREMSPLAPETATRGVAYAALFLTAFLVVYTPTLAIVALAFIFLGLFAASQLPDGPRSYSIGIRGTASSLRLVGSLLGMLIVVAASLGLLCVLLSDIWINRAAVTFASTKNAVTARTLIEQALKIDPQNDRAHRAAVELGIIELQQLVASGATDEAAKAKLLETLSATLEHGLTAVSINGRNYQNWFTLASLYADYAGQNISGALDQARNAYKKSLESNPTNPLPLLRLAQLELLANNVVEAQQYLGKAVQVKPDFAAAFYLDSQINAGAGNYDVAIAEATEAVRLVPDDPQGWFNVGVIAYMAKQYDIARQALERAVSIQNTYANALYFLGHTYYQLGQRDNALIAFREVQKSNPDNAEIKKIVEDLAAGKKIQGVAGAR